MPKIELKEAKKQLEWTLKTMSSADYSVEEAVKKIVSNGNLWGWTRKLSGTNDRIIWEGKTFRISKAAGRWVVTELK